MAKAEKKGSKTIVSAEKIWEHIRCRWDLWFLGIVLLIFNFPLFLNHNTDSWAFYPTLVEQGKWWLIITSQLTHITRYHFLLDGIPFFLIYCTLEEKKPLRRFLYVIFAGIGSTVAATLFSPDIVKYGLRGLSGITYGVMAISAMEIAFNQHDKKNRRVLGGVILLLLVSMITWELLTGKFPFEFLLFNMVGKPILVCHAGGLIGALIGYLMLRIWRM